jgi:hypothetical protein
MAEVPTRDVMLICATTREIPDAVDAALDAARAAGGGLRACFILDREAVLGAGHRLTAVGLGAGLGGRAEAALQAEYRSRAKTQLGAIAARAGSAGVPCRTFLREGAFVETCLEEIRREPPARVILSRKRRSQYARILFSGAIDRLTAGAGVDVAIVDDD